MKSQSPAVCCLCEPEENWEWRAARAVEDREVAGQSIGQLDRLTYVGIVFRFFVSHPSRDLKVSFLMCTTISIFNCVPPHVAVRITKRDRLSF